jgi:hypothetical protein
MSRAVRAALVAVAGAAATGALRRRRSRRARVGLYFSDGLLMALPPASPAALPLRAAAGDVLRAFSPVASVQSAGSVS